MREWAHMSEDPDHKDNWLCDDCIKQYRTVKDQCSNIGEALEQDHFKNYKPIVCCRSNRPETERPLCQVLKDLRLTKRGWTGSTRFFQEIAYSNKNILNLNESKCITHTFTTFSLFGRQARAFICRNCFLVDAEVHERKILDPEEYFPNHRCPSIERKRHQAESVILESESFFSMESMDTDSAGHEICEKYIQYDSLDSKIRMRLECQAERMTKAEACAHKQICPCRTGNQSFSRDNIGNLVKLLWSIAKQSGADKALIDHINKDLCYSQAANGISLLRKNVTVSNCDIYTLDGYSNYHVVHRNPKHKDRRKASLEVTLSTHDIKLLSGAGSTISNLKHVVKQLHRSNIPTSKNTVKIIQEERKTMRDCIELVTLGDVARRHNQKNRGQSHLVRFKNEKLMQFLNQFIYDSNGEQRSFVKDSHSISISSDHGKGSLKLVLCFNSPKFSISSNESILLALAKCCEDQVSLQLLMESSWPMLVHEFAKVLNKSLFLTGDHKNLSLLFGTGGGSAEYCCVFCHTPRKTQIDSSANPGDKKTNLPSDRTKQLANFDEFYGKISVERKRKIDDWNNENVNSENKDSVKKLQPMNPLIKSLMRSSNLQYVEELAIVPGLHFKLAWNKYFEYATSPVKWIFNFNLKSRNGQLSETENQFLYNCKLIERTVFEIQPKRHGPTGQLDAQYTGPNIDKIIGKSETIVKLLETQQLTEGIDLEHSIKFFKLSSKLNCLCNAILDKELDPEWRAKLHDFRNYAIEFLRNCRHIGLIYLHSLIHIEDIIERTGVSLLLIGNDQV